MVGVRKLWGRRSRAIAGGLIVAAAISGGVATVTGAFASTTGTTTLNACENKAGGLRLVSGPSSCRPDETAVHWNVVGPTGPQGPTGATGPAGPAGPSAPSSVPHQDVVGTLTFTPPSASQPLTTDLYSFDMPMSQALNVGSQSSGAGAGKVTFDPATLTLPVGDASMALNDLVTAGGHLSSATVVLYAPNSTTPAVTVELKMVAPTSADLTNDGAATSSLQDQFSIEYGAAQYTLASSTGAA